MKLLLFLSFALLPALGFAQQAPATPAAPAATPKPPAVLPPKKANAAIIMRRDSGLVALTALMQGLVNRGYSLRDVDRTTLTVRTEPRAVSEVGAVVLDGAVRGRQLVLTGAYAPELNSKHFKPVEYPGEKRESRASMAWDELTKTAALLGRSVTYRVQ